MKPGKPGDHGEPGNMDETLRTFHRIRVRSSRAAGRKLGVSGETADFASPGFLALARRVGAHRLDVEPARDRSLSVRRRISHAEGTCSDSRSDGIDLLDHERGSAWTLLPDELLRRNQRLRRRGRFECSCARCRRFGSRDDRRSQHVGRTRDDRSGPRLLLRTGPLLADAVVHTAEDRSAKVQLNRSVASPLRLCLNARPNTWPSVSLSAPVAGREDVENELGLRRGTTEQWKTCLGHCDLASSCAFRIVAYRSSSGITTSDSRVRRRLWTTTS